MDPGGDRMGIGFCFVLENCTNSFIPTVGSRFFAFAVMSSPKT